jgi:hypothetical protein
MSSPSRANRRVALGKLAKFEGEVVPGKQPVETIECGNDSADVGIEDDVSSLFDADKLLALLRLCPEECFISPENAQDLRTRVTEWLLYLDHRLEQEILTFPAKFRTAELARKDLRGARRRAEHVAVWPTDSAVDRAATALRQAKYRSTVYRAKELVAAGRESLQGGKVVEACIHFFRALELGPHGFAFSDLRSKKRKGSESRAESAPAKELEPAKVAIRGAWERAHPAIEAELKKNGIDPNQLEQKVFEHVWKLVRDGSIKIPFAFTGESKAEKDQGLRRKLRRILIDLGLIQKDPQRGRPKHSPLRSALKQPK